MGNLSELELKCLGEVLTRIEYERTAPPQAIAAVHLLIFTGCRSVEILGLRWDEVDYERQCLHLKDSKTDKRTVMLNTATLEIFQDLDRVEGSPFVIPGRTPDKPLSSLQRLWDRVRGEELDISTITLKCG